jgi:Ca2+-binding EF-hand superfamily protein
MGLVSESSFKPFDGCRRLAAWLPWFASLKFAVLLIIFLGAVFAWVSLPDAGQASEPVQGGGLTAKEALRRRSERLKEFLQTLDADDDGMLDADEVAGGQKVFLERMLRTAGVEVKYPLSVREVREALMKMYQSQVPAVGSSQSNPAASTTPPPVQPRRSASGLTPEEMLRRRSERLKEFLRKLDTNANGTIDADEVRGGQRVLLEQMVRGAAVEVKYPLSVPEIQEALMKTYQPLAPAGGPDGAEDPPPEETLAERAERLERFLGKLDANGDGMLAADEVSAGQKLFLGRMLRSAAVEVKYPLSIRQVRQALMKSKASKP